MQLSGDLCVIIGVLNESPTSGGVSAESRGVRRSADRQQRSGLIFASRRSRAREARWCDAGAGECAGRKIAAEEFNRRYPKRFSQQLVGVERFQDVIVRGGVRRSSRLSSP
jgi:hypothetical protein